MRAAFTISRSTFFTPSKVLKKTTKNTISHAMMILDRLPKPKISVTSGTSAMRGRVLKATMNGSKMAAR